MSSIVQDILEQLDHIEHILHRTGLHSDQPPPASAINSQMPFCCDQLQFYQWLQWVLIPDTRDLLATGRSLPGQNHIFAVAETELAGLSFDTDELLSAIRRLEQLFRQL